MKILIIGSEGSMGKRYTAIFKYFFPDVELALYDTMNFVPLNLEGVYRALVCSPTETHYEMCKMLIENKIDFMCEKPISKNPEEIKELIALAKEKGVNGYMCNNWQFSTSIFHDPNSVEITYDYYNPGKDGLYWDCIQLVYLGKEDLKIRNTSPIFLSQLDLEIIDTEKIQWSYLKMINSWISDFYEQLWTLEDGLAATEKVIEYIKQKEAEQCG